MGNDGPVLFFKTDLDAPRRRLVAIDLRKPQPADWKEIIPQAEATLTQVSLVGDRFIACYLKDVVSPGEGVFHRRPVRPRHRPAGHRHGRRLRRQADRHARPFTAFPASPRRRAFITTTWPRGVEPPVAPVGGEVQPEDYEVEQVFYHSKDGTRVPMFIAYKKGIKLDGSNPTLLYGYGGFNISRAADVLASAGVAWMEMGGVYAQANLRGGGEYGEAWHEAGTKLKKQNVFDDFIAAAEWLIAEKYTRPDKLAIQGGSNGGLLVGAVMTQRPELFGACLPEVGVMDMLRFHKFTEGRTWVDDYGSSDNRRAVQGPAGLFALSQHQAGHLLSGHAGDHGRHRRPRGARPQLQVRRRVAACPGLRQPGADPHRHPRRPRRRKAASASGSKRSPTSGRSW